jgi:hypothetical protein
MEIQEVTEYDKNLSLPITFGACGPDCSSIEAGGHHGAEASWRACGLIAL